MQTFLFLKSGDFLFGNSAIFLIYFVSERIGGCFLFYNDLEDKKLAFSILTERIENAIELIVTQE